MTCKICKEEYGFFEYDICEECRFIIKAMTKKDRITQTHSDCINKLLERIPKNKILITSKK